MTRCTPRMVRRRAMTRATDDWLVVQPAISIAGAGTGAAQASRSLRRRRRPRS